MEKKRETDTLRSGETDTAPETSSGGPTRTLDRGLFLLGLFDVDNPEWTARELRERAGLPKATTRRLLKTLEASKWVAYEPTTGKYHLGSRVLQALFLATSHSELTRIAHPFLTQLAEETTESASLAVWTDRGAIRLDTVRTSRPFKVRISIGMLLPGFASAEARVLVAFGPEEAWDALLAVTEVPRTEHTTTDPQKLREELLKIRREGVAIERQEWREGVAALGAPVFDQSGAVRACLLVVVPIERCSEVQVMKYAAAVRKAAADLSQELGYGAKAHLTEPPRMSPHL